jgi:predicted phosphodiesterase
MRIAVLADVHGNLPALRAVLAQLDGEPVDAIVVAGDVVGGPLPRETLEALAARPEAVHWVAGNAERETVAGFDGDGLAMGHRALRPGGARMRSMRGGATRLRRGRSASRSTASVSATARRVATTRS